MKTIIKGNFRFEVNYICSEADNPRDDCNLGKMFFLHQKYIIGDKHNYSGDDFSSWEEVKEFIEEDDDSEISLSEYLEDCTIGDEWNTNEVKIICSKT